MNQSNLLNQLQPVAIDSFRQHALQRKSEALSTINHILKMSNISQDVYSVAIDKLKKTSQVAFHFHPDRLDNNMVSVAESLCETGLYKSQFETLISNGSVSAHAGGDRDLWEEKLYKGAYQQGEFDEKQRPKYGALNIFKHAHGPAPRFGSCYFLLQPEVSERCTYTYMDSYNIPEERGTIDGFDDIMCALLSEIFTRNYALGEHGLSTPKFIKFLNEDMDKSYDKLPHGENHRNLNHYIEVQVHGEVSLERDVECLVADPSFKKTSTGEFFQKISDKYNIKLFWHGGYRLPLAKVPSDFRGPGMPSLAQKVITVGDILTAKMIGDCARSLKKNPEFWAERGSFNEVLQELKLLWHVLVTYGSSL